jgi:hypothetical protein
MSPTPPLDFRHPPGSFRHFALYRAWSRSGSCGVASDVGAAAAMAWTRAAGRFAEWGQNPMNREDGAAIGDRDNHRAKPGGDGPPVMTVGPRVSWRSGVLTRVERDITP